MAAGETFMDTSDEEEESYIDIPEDIENCHMVKHIMVNVISICDQINNWKTIQPNNKSEALNKSRTLRELRTSRRKWVRELDKIQNCNFPECPDHSVPNPTLTANDFKKDFPEIKQTEIYKPNSKKKKPNNNSKNNNNLKTLKTDERKRKETEEDFSFPNKTARPSTPTTPKEITTENSFEMLEPELNITEKTNNESIEPKPVLPPPIMLKSKPNYLNQLKKLNETFPDLRNRLSGEYIKLYVNTSEEYRLLVRTLDADKEYEFYVITPKTEKPLKIVIKGLPRDTPTDTLKSELEDCGFTIDKVAQLISKKTNLPLPMFQVTLPRNIVNNKIYELTNICYLKINIEPFTVNGTTQCFNCNLFNHTAANCHSKPRCIKCGKQHPTSECNIKEKLEKPICINCGMEGHVASYHNCPKFPKPKNTRPKNNVNSSPQFFQPRQSQNVNNPIRKGFSYADAASNNYPNSNQSDNQSNYFPPPNFRNNQNNPNAKFNPLSNVADLFQIIEFLQMIADLLTKMPNLPNLINKFKNASSDPNRALALLETLLN